MPTTHTDILIAGSKVEEVKSAYLRRWGWNYTCNTPGALWMWTRDFSDIDAKRKAWDAAHGAGNPGGPSVSRPYGLVMGSLDQAVRMTVGTLDEQPELDDDSDQ